MIKSMKGAYGKVKESTFSVVERVSIVNLRTQQTKSVLIAEVAHNFQGFLHFSQSQSQISHFTVEIF